MAIEYKLSYTASQIDEKLGKIDSLATKAEVPSVVETALAEAKASGEFTPQKGTDYFTSADKAEIVSAVVDALPKYNGEAVVV